MSQEKCMKLHEYQAKELLAGFGVPVPQGSVASNKQEAIAAAEKLGGAAVVKAQVHAGGRGKAGGVKVAATPDEAGAYAESLIGTTLVTFQTGPQGAPVHKVLVEQTMDIDREIYFSITTDGGMRRPVIIASAEGGMEIEEVAQNEPEKVHTEPIDPAIGFQPFQGRRIAGFLSLPTDQVRAFVWLADACYKAYMAKDASMIEINPLVLTKDGRMLALDAKVSVDDDALFRHKLEAELRDSSQEDPLEVEASEAGIAYVKLDGNVGCMVNGAGLAMATMDIIKLYGRAPANFLDVGGGATKERVAEAFKIILADEKVEAILVNIFGGIMRCDVLAEGIVTAARELGLEVPLVVRLEGTNVVRGKAILAESGLAIISADSLGDAAERVVAATKTAA
jgi:succinyl-CoA synthetase beta subunit